MPEAYTIADQDRMTRAVNYFRWQQRLAMPWVGRRVVEVGCGIGNFTGALLDRELVVASDPERACCLRLRERYPDRPNLPVLVAASGEACFAALAQEHPDTCVCLNVLEHIEGDAGALAAMGGVLAPGGALILLTPAFPAL